MTCLLIQLKCAVAILRGKLINQREIVAVLDDLRATIHGNDERVPLKAIEDGVRFYLELISRS